MSLTEPQIQRFARHILLPEVGGRGQARLLSAEVIMHGDASWVGLAGAYLRAAGTTCKVASDAARRLEVSINGANIGDVVVRGEAEGVVVVASATGAGLGSLAATNSVSPSTEMLSAALAATEALQLILELGSGPRAWRVCGHRVTRVEP